MNPRQDVLSKLHRDDQKDIHRLDSRIIDVDPSSIVLSDVDGIVTSARCLSVVVYDALESVSILESFRASFRRGYAVFRDLEVRTVRDELVRLEDTSPSAVVVESLEVQDQDRWQGLDEDLLRGVHFLVVLVGHVRQSLGVGDERERIGDGLYV